MRVASLKLRTFVSFWLFFCQELSAAERGDPATYRAWTADFRRRDPAAEAKKNFASGKIYVVAAMGFALYFPGIDQKIGEQLRAQYGAKFLKGTSDAIENEVHKVYLETAGKFAAGYNRETVKLLRLPSKE